MGRGQRRTERALERLDAAYGDAMRPHRLAMGERRAALTASPDGRAAVLAELAGWHHAAVAVARRAADAEGGPGWLARLGHDDDWVHERLWDDLGRPLTGVTWYELAASTAAAASGDGGAGDGGGS